MLSWIEQRTGTSRRSTGFLTEDVPGGASYWYAFRKRDRVRDDLADRHRHLPHVLLLAVGRDRVGIDEVHHRQARPDGLISSSVSTHWGATAMIALVVMHFLQVLLWGAYKKPREVQWIVGVFLLLFTAVIGLTGYLLPWDLNAFFASQVAINIAGSVPVIGPATQTFIQDGATIGTLTINRFFGIHVWLMPVLLIALTAAHLAIFRHNGAAGPPADAAPKLKPGRFWPNQMFMDTVASGAVFLIIVLLSIFSPTPLDQKADPNDTAFQPYPAWYFLALFQLLEVAGDKFQLVATVIVPGGLVTLLLLLPFIDRNPSRRIQRRPWLVGGTALVMVGAIYLSCAAQNRIEAQQLASAGDVAAANAAASASQPAAAPVNTTNAGGKGATIFAANCSGCHAANGTGGVGPPLAGNPYVTGDPKHLVHTLLYGLGIKISVDGKSYSGGMPAWKSQLSDADIAAVATFLRASWGNKASAVTEAEVAKVLK